MKSANKWLVSICVLLLLTIIVLFIQTFSFNEKTTNEWVINPEDIQRNAQQQYLAYQKQVQLLSEKNNELQTELTKTRQNLHAAKRKMKPRESVIQSLVDNMEKTDHPLAESPCDSLRDEVVQYIHDVNEKDSLYERQTDIVDSVFRIKDSVIVLQNQNLASVNQQLQIVSIHAEALLKENKLLRRQERRRKVFSTLKTVGVGIAAGIVTNLVSNR